MQNAQLGTPPSLLHPVHFSFLFLPTLPSPLAAPSGVCLSFPRTVLLQLSRCSGLRCCLFCFALFALLRARVWVPVCFFSLPLLFSFLCFACLLLSPVACCRPSFVFPLLSPLFCCVWLSLFPSSFPLPPSCVCVCARVCVNSLAFFVASLVRL